MIGLRAEGAVLRATEGDDVDARVGGEGAQRLVQRCGGVRQSGAVHEHAHTAPVGVFGDGTYLVGGVDGAELAGLGDVDDERLRPVLVVPSPRLLGDEVRGELSVGRGDREQLDARDLLGRSAFVGVDVGGLGADDRSPARQHRHHSHDVRPGAVEHRIRGDTVTEVPDAHVLQAFGVHVLAIGDLVSVVGRGDGGKHFGVHTRVVVGGEAADAASCNGVTTVQSRSSSVSSCTCSPARTENIGKHPISPRPVCP